MGLLPQLLLLPVEIPRNVSVLMSQLLSPEQPPNNNELNTGSFQGRASFWLRVPGKTSGNGSMFILSGVILLFKWPRLTPQS